MPGGRAVKDAPFVQSTSSTAGKFFVRVPEELWGDVCGFGLSHTNGVYEVLWKGRQGIVAGQYPGKGAAPEGYYRLVRGSFDAIPQAPDWLIEEMLAAAAERKKKVEQRHEKPLEVRQREVEECLAAIDPADCSDYSDWLKVGMAVHSADLENGLELWKEWSQRDPQYKGDWKSSDPCSSRWESFKGDGGIGMGSLVYLARRNDPEVRFTKGKKEEEEGHKKDPGGSIIQRLIAIHQHIPELTAQREEIQALAQECKWRVDDLYDHYAKHMLTLSGHGRVMNLMEMPSSPTQYLIPGVLPYGALVLVHGDGGAGKTSFALQLAAAVMEGAPMLVLDKEVAVTQGKVLYISSDQRIEHFRDQIEIMGLSADLGRMVFLDGWHMTDTRKFENVMQQVIPSLVIIDSLSSCSLGGKFSENETGYASPLYWLANQAQKTVGFPFTTIVLHHNNKLGGFRGTSAIRDAVDECWAMKIENADRRVISLDKSRYGLDFGELQIDVADDCRVSLSTRASLSGASLSQANTTKARVLGILRDDEGWLTAQEICDRQAMIKASVKAIRTALARLRKQGLIEHREEPTSGGQNRYLYRAL